MKIVFDPDSWDDYLHWQATDRKMVEKINALIKACIRDAFEGIGKPEPLRGDLSGWWSRRIDREHRLVYRIAGDQLQIVQCRRHY